MKQISKNKAPVNKLDKDYKDRLQKLIESKLSINPTGQINLKSGNMPKIMETNNLSWDEFTSEMLDRMEILSIIDLYIAGLMFGRTAALKLAFHPNAIMYGVSPEEKPSEGSIERLYNTIEKNGPLSKLTSQITILHQTTNTAIVLAELKNTSLNQNSTDHLSMMKIDGNWKIISKVYHLSYASETKENK